MFDCKLRPRSLSVHGKRNFLSDVAMREVGIALHEGRSNYREFHIPLVRAHSRLRYAARRLWLCPRVARLLKYGNDIRSRLEVRLTADPDPSTKISPILDIHTKYRPVTKQLQSWQFPHVTLVSSNTTKWLSSRMSEVSAT